MIVTNIVDKELKSLTNEANIMKERMEFKQHDEVLLNCAAKFYPKLGELQKGTVLSDEDDSRVMVDFGEESGTYEVWRDEIRSSGLFWWDK